MSENEKSAVQAELAAAVREKIINRQKFAEHTGVPFEAEDAVAAALLALTDHLHDPRTIERCCESYFANTSTNWKDLNLTTQDVWRKNMQVILCAALG